MRADRLDVARGVLAGNPNYTTRTERDLAHALHDAHVRIDAALVECERLMRTGNGRDRVLIAPIHDALTADVELTAGSVDATDPGPEDGPAPGQVSP